MLNLFSCLYSSRSFWIYERISSSFVLMVLMFRASNLILLYMYLVMFHSVFKLTKGSLFFHTPFVFCMIFNFAFCVLYVLSCLHFLDICCLHVFVNLHIVPIIGILCIAYLIFCVQCIVLATLPLSKFACVHHTAIHL